MGSNPEHLPGSAGAADVLRLQGLRQRHAKVRSGTEGHIKPLFLSCSFIPSKCSCREGTGTTAREQT